MSDQSSEQQSEPTPDAGTEAEPSTTEVNTGGGDATINQGGEGGGSGEE